MIKKYYAIIKNIKINCKSQIQKIMRIYIFKINTFDIEKIKKRI